MAIEFIHTQTAEIGIHALADEIIQHIKDGEKVLWLVPGGSNIPISVEVMNQISLALDEKNMSNLSIALTDERYGPVGHQDSNWQQLLDKGFIFPTHKTPVLFEGMTIEETVANYQKNVDELFSSHNHIVGQFGIGSDGHIAGVLPHTIGVTSRDAVVGYQSERFMRISLSLSTLSRIHSAYAFVFGKSKHDVIQKLHSLASLSDMPSQILQKIAKASVYTDHH